MKRFLITFPSTLDALLCDRAVRENGYSSSFIPVRRTTDDSPPTVALEVEAESEPEIRELAGKRGAAVLDVKSIA
ncbi:MAG: DUF3343 domain-containing protein [Planctomycetes bacterium]|nr:DUF3343 domain-containing protein [Planctomycetota bacterium]MBI3845000.1 DUF3343 domain-containing protein [Planctomycetota bacterium]